MPMLDHTSASLACAWEAAAPPVVLPALDQVCKLLRGRLGTAGMDFVAPLLFVDVMHGCEASIKFVWLVKREPFFDRAVPLRMLRSLWLHELVGELDPLLIMMPGLCSRDNMAALE